MSPPDAESVAIPHLPTNASKKKKKKTKRAGDALDDSAPSLAATAQVQADLLATASDLYRRIEADPAGLPDDEAYWTSLPAHLRTFIRNALPLGHLAEPGANPNALPRHASTQAMIAVAQQLAQAAHASQRHLPGSGNQTYSSPLTLDPSMFVDAPMLADLPLTKNGLSGHLPSPGMQAAAVPGENGFGSVVLVNELDEDDDFHDEYASDDVESIDVKEPAPKKKSKKKKKKSAPALDDDVRLPPPPAIPPPLPLPKSRPSALPPPSSRAAGKLPMTFAPPRSTAPPAPRPPLAKRAPKSHSHHRAMFPAQMPGAAPPASGSGLTIGSAEERERIRDFWQHLSERERKRLVDAEQQGVLRKLKDFQRHACACRVCMRKRNAIDVKLSELYKTYYDALESHATQYTKHVESDGAQSPPAGPGPFPGSIALDSHGSVVGANLLLSRQSYRKDDERRPRRHPYVPVHPREIDERRDTATPPTPDVDDLYEDEELDEDEYEDEYDDHPDDDLDADLDLDSDRPDALRKRDGPCHGSECYCINSSLTVKGILTVADDLSGNEVQKLILMMEQLAERHLQPIAADDAPDDDESLPSEVELTPDEQREQGWRMFQIFAARILEHRVLHAYRETVAQERQLQLLRELEEEESNEKAREAKRAKENQRKKDKKKYVDLLTQTTQAAEGGGAPAQGAGAPRRRGRRQGRAGKAAPGGAAAPGRAAAEEGGRAPRQRGRARQEGGGATAQRGRAQRGRAQRGRAQRGRTQRGRAERSRAERSRKARGREEKEGAPAPGAQAQEGGHACVAIGAAGAAGATGGPGCAFACDPAGRRLAGARVGQGRAAPREGRVGIAVASPVVWHALRDARGAESSASLLRPCRGAGAHAHWRRAAAWRWDERGAARARRHAAPRRAESSATGAGSHRPD